VEPSLAAPPASTGVVVTASGHDDVLIGPRSTMDVLRLLGGLDVAPGLLARVLAPFPVAGRATYTDGGRDGVDINADRGTPVIASGDGTISQMDAAAVTLAAVDGAAYSYSHLEGLAPGLAVGKHMAKGDVLGFVGVGADAPHLHYEIRINGAPMPPVPYLDRWLAEAKQAAELLRGGSPGAQSLVGSAAAAASAAGGAAGAVVDGARRLGASSASAVRGAGAKALRAGTGAVSLALLALPLPLWWLLGRRGRRRLQLG
jgi:hypothetical protein